MTQIWISTDEAEDVAGAIRQALRSYRDTETDPQAWKYMLLALHSALQGACTCHLLTTAHPIGAVTDKNAGEWIDYLEKSRTNPAVKHPKTYMLNAVELAKRVRNANSSGDGCSSAILIAEPEIQWIRRIHDEVRNELVHFSPKGWSIEVSGIPEFAKLVSRIIGEIIAHGWAFRHQSPEWTAKLQRDLAALSSL